MPFRRGAPRRRNDAFPQQRRFWLQALRPVRGKPAASERQGAPQEGIETAARWELRLLQDAQTRCATADSGTARCEDGRWQAGQWKTWRKEAMGT